MVELAENPLSDNLKNLAQAQPYGLAYVFKHVYRVGAKDFFLSVTETWRHYFLSLLAFYPCMICLPKKNNLVQDTEP